ncbi:MAG: polyhydroxyalkanoate synthesis repressor PhaR [Alphaproteobacteria bacterium]|nr:polyhydroxyalkanoate synthesis repressor PhaR [Alphaproteobacteria bacterium]
MTNHSNSARDMTAAALNKAEQPANSNDIVVIKKYANRRLYNTVSSSYVTLDSLSDMVKQNIDFVVFDARTGEDITRSVLTQIIVEEENKGQNLLPVGFLRHLISYYGNSMQWLVPSYLESTMNSFTNNQEQMRKYFTEAFGGIFSFDPLQQMTRQNMAMIEQAMKVFSPFQPGTGAPGKAPSGVAVEPAPTPPPPPEPRREAEIIAEMKSQLETLQNQVASLSQNQPK